MTRKPAFAPPIGSLPVLQYLQPTQLKVDPSYQRSIENAASQKLIASIARDWNWDLCQVLVVSRRGDQGLFVVDGQHRLQAALMRGDIAQLPCVLANYDSSQQEAAVFAKLNRQRTPLKAIDIFRAAVAGRDPEACRLMSLMTQAGVQLATSTNNVHQAPGAVSNIGGIREAQRTYGDKSTLKALRILRTGFDGQVLRYAGTIFGGIAGTVGDAEKSGHPVSEALLVAVLAGADQADWFRDIMAHKGKFPEMRPAQAATHIISTAYEEAAADDEVVAA
ncbi:hypothetical protein M527_07225 [Sphingobium indicum IP26]|uniref:ParB/Sulfiredoxin domain-containing protein n=1 Tax=Sphingobium indicum F2 TaxID=1450518 RepID=A0A8E0WSP2_9SPHN|nr:MULTISPECIES: DUF6551 family protein [Sphingobium]EPR09908.1 hypothetical protein M527_07225 [Sphingobium indicum IP26]EQB05036.1 hypothetical protein L286_09740 [Sphingobium sp. HDIP04]KER36701.1 hypothetical protein AL00_09520 [Sphingobium indicum F2]